jgi:hypothetical protein
LLAILQCSLFSASGTLPIHPEPKNRDKQTGHSGGNVLPDLESLLACKFADPVIVGLDFGRDRGAIRVLEL